VVPVVAGFPHQEVVDLAHQVRVTMVVREPGPAGILAAAAAVPVRLVLLQTIIMEATEVQGSHPPYQDRQ
jgi:hypothetical protein